MALSLFSALDPAVRLAMVTEARLLFGEHEAGQLWLELGLPRVDGQPVSPSQGARAPQLPRRQAGSPALMRLFEDFFAAACEPDPLTRLRASVLLAAHRRWALDQGRAALTATMLGRMMNTTPFRRTVSNVIHYEGIRLRPAFAISL